MTGTSKFFALADADDASGLLAALGATPAHAVRSETGETVFLYSLYRGKAKCVEALRKRGGLTLQEAAAAGDLARVEACIAAASWTIHSLSADGWTALHLAAFLGRDDVVVRLLEFGADPRQWGRAFEQIFPSTRRAPDGGSEKARLQSSSPRPAIRTSRRNMATRR